jgi:HAD superfamily hydrolase (TIGR01549 family)
MYYKGIIFDLDNTLYNYTYCHTIALRTCIEYLCKNTQISDPKIFEAQYDRISKQLKNELPGVASSHNKAIYFKQLLENLGLGLSDQFTNIHDLYWRTFYENMKSYDGLYEFIEWNHKNEIKIGILTDYETEYQIVKLEKLGLLKFVDHIVTSEEVGIEKPSKQAFLTILNKMKLAPEHVLMIGDNYEKDILGALEIGMKGLLFCPDSVPSTKVVTSYIVSYRELLHDTEKFHKKLLEFVEISRYCGERFDLVQAGGGNVSVKIGDKMIIKSSGVHMANITATTGYSIIDNFSLKQDMQNKQQNKQQNQPNNNELDICKYIFMGSDSSQICRQIRPSIETYMHSFLKTYTIHVHPIQVNRILITKTARQQITELFPDALIMDYYTPGLILSEEIMKIYKGESVIFLINHGIIFTTDNYHEIRSLLEQVLEKCEQYQGLDFTKYKQTNRISQYINHQETDIRVSNITYLSTNRDIYYFLENHRELFFEPHTFPDALIYCGMRILEVHNSENLKREIDLYRKTYFEFPKIIIYHENFGSVLNSYIYIIANTYQKCKEIEDVLLANLWILYNNTEKQYLSESEIHYLNGWDAEKYRKTL